jgi:hypothetical protein
MPRCSDLAWLVTCVASEAGCFLKDLYSIDSEEGGVRIEGLCANRIAHSCDGESWNSPERDAPIRSQSVGGFRGGFGAPRRAFP